MKTPTFAVILLAFTLISCDSPHRLETWETENISSIQVEMKQSDGTLKMMNISDKKEIKEVLDFLLQTTFNPYTEGSLIEMPAKDQWTIRLIFEGQRDQIFLFEDIAFIGKSIYLINNRVLIDFKKLLDNIK